MKKLLGAVCLLSLLSLASTLAFAQEYYRLQNEGREYRDGRYSPRGPQARPFNCSAEWIPVCARTRSNIVARYSNSCFAEQDGAIVIGNQRECETLPPAPSCPAIYEPVCARIIVRANRPDEPIDRRIAEEIMEKEPRTLVFRNKAFFNDCAAREIGRGTVLTPYSEGRNRSHGHYLEHKFFRGVVDMASVCPTTCSGRIDLVCGKDDEGRERLYANRCSAILEGAVILHPGVCNGQAIQPRRR